MKAGYLFKKNVETLLKARGHTRHDLAFYCRRSDAWISKILGNSDRNLPMKYLDRIADFFGIATYQLFQPGISPLTERRKGPSQRPRPSSPAPSPIPSPERLSLVLRPSLPARGSLCQRLAMSHERRAQAAPRWT